MFDRKMGYDLKTKINANKTQATLNLIDTHLNLENINIFFV